MKRVAAAGGPRTVTLRRFGRLLPGLVIVVAAWAALEIPLEADRVELVAFAMAGGVALFFALMVLQATMCFWTTESLELMNILTYGGVETASYRLPIATGCSGFFAFIVPLPCICYFPIVAVLGVDDPLGISPMFQAAAPWPGSPSSAWPWAFGNLVFGETHRREADAVLLTLLTPLSATPDDWATGRRLG